MLILVIFRVIFAFNARIDDFVLGDYHSAELEFVWDNQWPPVVHAFSENDQKMADTVDTYFSNMVWFGNPNGQTPADLDGQEYWEQYDNNNMADMILALPTQMEHDYFEQACEFWDDYEPGSKPHD
jgi:carboxylesterase type B